MNLSFGSQNDERRLPDRVQRRAGRSRALSGDRAIIEADSAAALAKASAPFTPWLRFTGKPILPIEEAAAIAGEGIALRESVR